jgi:hypothetical protein
MPSGPPGAVANLERRWVRTYTDEHARSETGSTELIWRREVAFADEVREVAES